MIAINPYTQHGLPDPEDIEGDFGIVFRWKDDIVIARYDFVEKKFQDFTAADNFSETFPLTPNEVKLVKLSDEGFDAQGEHKRTLCILDSLKFRESVFEQYQNDSEGTFPAYLASYVTGAAIRYSLEESKTIEPDNDIQPPANGRFNFGK